MGRCQSVVRRWKISSFAWRTSRCILRIGGTCGFAVVQSGGRNAGWRRAVRMFGRCGSEWSFHSGRCRVDRVLGSHSRTSRQRTWIILAQLVSFSPRRPTISIICSLDNIQGTLCSCMTGIQDGIHETRTPKAQSTILYKSK